MSRNRSQKLAPIAIEGDLRFPYLKCKLITSCAHVTQRTGRERTSDWQTFVSHILQQYTAEQYEGGGGRIGWGMISIAA